MDPVSCSMDHESRIMEHGSRITYDEHESRITKRTRPVLLSSSDRSRPLSLSLSLRLRLPVSIRRPRLRMFGRAVAWRRNGRSGVDRWEHDFSDQRVFGVVTEKSDPLVKRLSG
jgi:hypothetical protein